MKTETHYLKAVMTSDEKQEALIELPKVLDQLDITTDDKKRAAKEFADTLKMLEESKERLREEIRTGMRYKDVECAWRGDTLIRLDTEEVIDVRDPL